MRLLIKKHECCVCGETKGAFRNSTIGVLCQKHFRHFERNGRIMNSDMGNTRILKNQINDIGNGVSEIIILDRYQNPKCKTIVDTEDVPKLSEYKWCDSKGYVFGSKNINNTQKTVFLHRFLVNAERGFVVDHINGNPLDNRKSNLRICSQKQNVRNRHKKNGHISKCIGVSCDKRTGRWYSRIRKQNGSTKYLGSFSTEEEAIQARLAAEDKYYGEFAPQYNSQFR